MLEAWRLNHAGCIPPRVVRRVNIVIRKQGELKNASSGLKEELKETLELLNGSP
jgi:hypothetical protein